MTLVARHAVRTDIGLHREVNEDAAVVRPPLYAVCDGMGGARAGEVASDLACVTLAARTASGDDVADAARAANAAVYDAATADDTLAGMGTTLTAMIVDDRAARFAHVGDSRAYLLRDGELRQVSIDHSVVGQMVRDGELTVEQAAAHPMRSVLTRALGTEPSVEVDAYDLELRAGDVVLLCSDGLSGVVTDERIARLLAHDDPEESTAQLIKQARRAGGPDNITAVVVHFDEVGDEAAAEPDAGGVAAAAGATAVVHEGDTDIAVDPVDGAADATAATVDDTTPRLAAAPSAGGREAKDAWRLKIVLVVLVVLLILAAAAAVALQVFYFVGVDDGEVVVYSGLPWTLGPLKIKDVYVRGTRAYDSLTLPQRQLVDEAPIQSRDGALRLLETLETLP